ncbi:hypothetical protein HN512_04720 [Candidatus Peregrinibacteria bacterium]|jgi:hypothetical protein|nr:hypothetical protein [Candidatus Peregrinibacteria bacterium]MBT3599110.1 hypothetical protein [Candidatus Peregrinibacteria bacterium]MBT4367093.1 hypothetical protein [Candidatus Peregrinibacteria bacterium]MBT7008918.1 hypothetical protein [Candidatus Peregrinibacteria bacterium]MBT7344663.1 hypothetical protein [Candidatus Peregrinibacteria bacterium]
MKNRELSIGLSGVVVGLLIGAGSFAYSQDVSPVLEGSLLSNMVSYGDSTFEEAYLKNRSRRSVDQVRSVEVMHEAAPVAMPALTEEEKVSCLVKVRIVEELRETVLSLIPSRPIDLLVRAAIGSTFDKYIEDCIEVKEEVLQEQEEVKVTEELKEAAPAFVPDYARCDRLSGLRRSKCIVEQRDNQIFYQEGQNR